MGEQVKANTQKLGEILLKSAQNKELRSISFIYNLSNFIDTHLWFRKSAKDGIAIYQLEDGRFIHVSAVSHTYITKGKDYCEEDYLGCFKARFICNLPCKIIDRLKEKGFRNLVQKFDINLNKDTSLFLNDFP